jgi:dipeptidyl aminopeptidase/acylaminoacyl peptidase
VDISEVAIAPDGDEIAFVSDRSGAYELWTLALVGGAAPGEPVQRTHEGDSVSGVSYSPDGRSLVFARDRDGDERPDLYLLRRDASAPEALTRTPLAEQGARFSPDGTRLAFVSDPDRPFRMNVHVMDLATRATRKLTRDPTDVLSPRWARDGSTLVATATPDGQRGELVVIDVESGKERRLAPPARNGIAWPIEPVPSGALLAIATNAQGFAELAAVDLATGAARFLGPGDLDVDASDVAADGTALYAGNRRGESEIALRLPAAAAAATLWRGGVVRDLAIARRAPVAAVVVEESSRPPEVRLVALPGGAITTAVPAHLEGVDPGELGRAERVEVIGAGGLPIDVFVWRPRVARLGSPPPAVVWPHGGPESQTRAEFSPTFQALAEAGFVVVAPNYRGSSGYGRAFLDANNRDWGGGDLGDLLASVDALAGRGELDPARVGIGGGSYGGYLTLRAITAAPDRFHAAVDMYGMPDLVFDYRLTEDRFGTWYETEMGTPETHAELFRERSPIHALDRVRAPLLVLQGANDTNVPRAESDLVVEALRARGHPVDYRVYEGEGHGFMRRANRIDALERTVAFFVRWLGEPARASR